MRTIRNRDPWLDFLRALAITLVLIHHISQEWPVSRPWLISISRHGALGVDLFFVLSGWLIGGLFWKEMRVTGKVDLLRFWSRRWMRTVPPYAGGLVLAYVAVWLHRQEPFDMGYLVFAQNYYPVMPFFLISWSLCVEEHFYLLIPLIFVVAGKYTRFMLGMIVLIPVASRLYEYPVDINGFGYPLTATHLRADGLLLGFGVSYVHAFYSGWFEKYRNAITVSGIIAFFGWCLLLEVDIGYVINPLFVAIVFLGLLVFRAGRECSALIDNSLVFWVARISYSIYLTHVLVGHGFVLLIYPKLQTPEWFALLLQITMVLFVAWLFYMVFERTAFSIRERLVPPDSSLVYSKTNIR